MEVLCGSTFSYLAQLYLLYWNVRVRTNETLMRIEKIAHSNTPFIILLSSLWFRAQLTQETSQSKQTCLANIILTMPIEHETHNKIGNWKELRRWCCWAKKQGSYLQTTTSNALINWSVSKAALLFFVVLPYRNEESIFLDPSSMNEQSFSSPMAPLYVQLKVACHMQGIFAALQFVPLILCAGFLIGTIKLAQPIHV